MCWRVCFFSFLCVTFESCEAEGNVNELLITLPLATRSAHTSNLWADWLTFSLLLLLWPSFKYLRAGHTQSVIYSLLACQNKLKWLVRTAVPVFCVIKNPKAIKGIKHPELFRSSVCQVHLLGSDSSLVSIGSVNVSTTSWYLHMTWANNAEVWAVSEGLSLFWESTHCVV